jgi:monofunctional biosynthetic peptidoglycan transglycosylase
VATLPISPLRILRSLRSLRLPWRRNRRRPRLKDRLIRLFVLALIAPFAGSVALVALLRWVPPPTTAFALQWRLAHGTAPARRWVPWSEISKDLALAVVASEDQKFPLHSGFDFEAIGDAMNERKVNGRVRGASTISQQVAKNLFLWPEKSWLRKGIEVWLTVWIETLWPKRRILETYLNVAEFGPGVFGADAAARRFFGKPAAALDREQSALLAAVLPDPDRLHAARPSAYLLERRSWVLAQMQHLGGRSYLARLG